MQARNRVMRIVEIEGHKFTVENITHPNNVRAEQERRYRELVESTWPKYRCPECGWVGPEMEMYSDSLVGDIDQYSNYVCPACHYWHGSLSDYKKITTIQSEFKELEKALNDMKREIKKTRIWKLAKNIVRNTNACLTKRVCGFCRYYTPSRYIGTHLSEGWCRKCRHKKKKCKSNYSNDQM